MVIIVEGIDRVGKTTLCERLSGQIWYPIYKKEREKIVVPDVVNEYVNYGNAMSTVQLVNSNLADNFIFDRFQWTEAVYGKVDRKSQNSIKLMGYVEQEMCKNLKRWLMVYVRPTDLSSSSKNHGSDLSQHFKLYEELVSQTRLNTIIVENYNGIDKAIDKIIKYTNEEV